MKIAGYGRYKDDPEHVGCPRARTDMTPCVARDGALAVDDTRAKKPVCVGCGAGPRALLLELSEVYEPARRYRQTHDPSNAADTLRRLVREATGQASTDSEADRG
jgi:hypothetical protein